MQRRLTQAVSDLGPGPRIECSSVPYMYLDDWIDTYYYSTRSSSTLLVVPYRYSYSNTS